MTRYSIEPRTRIYVKGYGFFSFDRNLSNKYEKQLFHTTTKPGINASKKVVLKAAEGRDEFLGILGNKVNDVVAKSCGDKIVKTKPVEEIIIRFEKREEVLKRLRQEWNTIKYLNY